MAEKYKRQLTTKRIPRCGFGKLSVSMRFKWVDGGLEIWDMANGPDALVWMDHDNAITLFGFIEQAYRRK